MSLLTNLQNLITRIGTEFKTVKTYISGSGTGDVTGLATTATNLVGAINEVKTTADAAGGSAVTSVNGVAGPGAIVITTANVGEVTNLYFTDARAIAAPLTGFTSGAGTLAATDTILAGIQKLDGNINAISTTSLALSGGYSASAGTVAAADTIEVAIQKLDGNIQGLVTTNVAEGTNLYYTDARAIAAPITGFTSGAGALAATDTVLQAIQKLDGNVGALTTGVASVNGETGVVVIDGSEVALTGGYAAAAGTVAAADSLEAAIQKLDGNIAGLVTTNVAEGTNLYFTDARSIASPLTGYTAGAGTVAATDSILQAIQKLDGNAGALINDGAASTSNVWSSAKTDTEISSAVSGLLDAAPAALDTLNELAAALGDDAAFSTTVSTALGNRVRFDAAQTITGGNLTQLEINTNLGSGCTNFDYEAAFVTALS